MRLLRTAELTFEEFYDDQVPPYAILSHRWASPREEVSCTEFEEGTKQDTSGYAKIKRFCELAHQHKLEYAWIDTCCIQKSSSAELTEAINSMFRWYQRAVICFAYLADVETGSIWLQSDWFQRGWTLQELLAPKDVLFLDQNWRSIGTKFTLSRPIATITGIEQALLRGHNSLDDYSVAQKMSWSAKRKTSRLEDEAYSLLGLFDVNMPLLYGEGSKAFRRLQEEILKSGEDTSLFAWSDNGPEDYPYYRCHSILAHSPRDFAWSHNIRRGFATQRILFEVTNRGMMILFHHSYDPFTLDHLLALSKDIRRLDADNPLGLTIPLGCYRQTDTTIEDDTVNETVFLSLILDGSKWRKVGITSYFDPETTIRFKGAHYSAYKNDYVRIYVHHEMNAAPIPETPINSDLMHKDIRFLHIRDRYT